MTYADDVATLTAETVAEYAAGGYERDGIGLAFGEQPANDPAALGYGSDLAWDQTTGDIDDNASEVDGSTPAAVEQMISRFLQTPRSGLISDPVLLQAVGEDPNWGGDLTGLLSIGVGTVEFMAKRDLAVAGILEDDRVATCRIDLVQVGVSSEFNVAVTGTLRSGQTYKLILPQTGAAAITKAEQS
jgi:hypothetical protein